MGGSSVTGTGSGSAEGPLRMFQNFDWVRKIRNLDGTQIGDGRLKTSELYTLQGTTGNIQQQISAIAAVTTPENVIIVGRALASNVNGIPVAATTTTTELNYLSGTTSSVQTQINSKQATITGAATTIASSDLTASRALASDGSGKVAVSSVTSTELGYLSGISSSVQNQIDGKQATITGAATTITGSDLTASRALVANSSGKVAVSSVTSTELGYLSGASSSVQNQIDGKQATITGAATTITNSNLTGSRALASDGSGKVAVSAVTSAELGYLSGTSSSVQNQIDGKQATITGAATTITSSNLSTDLALIANSSGKVAVSAVTSTELGYLSGVSGAVQTQINEKQTTITGAASTVTSADLTVSRALISNSSGKIGISGTTATELGYLGGTTSAVQTQINSKQATITGAATTIASSDLTASRALTSDANGKVAVSAVTATELGYVSGATSNLQTQLASKSAISVETGTAATYSLTTVDNQVVIVQVKANLTLSGTAAHTVTLTYNGVTKDTLTIRGANTNSHCVMLQYTETPGAATANVVLATSNGTLGNIRYIIQKIS